MSVDGGGGAFPAATASVRGESGGKNELAGSAGAVRRQRGD